MRTVIVILSLFAIVPCHAQLLSRAEVINYLNEARIETNYQTSDPGSLVSEYTFRKLLANDFSLLTTGGESKATVGQYAALKLDKQEQTLSLTPFAWVPGNRPLRSAFHWIVTLDIEASTNSKQMFDFEERNKVKAGFSATWVNGVYHFYSTPRSNRRIKPDTAVYSRIHNELALKFIRDYNQLSSNVIDSVSSSKTFTSGEALQKAYLEKVSELEKSLTAEVWNLKRIYWFKVNVTPYSYDNFNIINTNNDLTYSKPSARAVYGPSLDLSLNYYLTYRWYGSFYVSGSIKAARKHSLSEVGTTTEWNDMTYADGSIFLLNDTKKVYVIDTEDIKTKFLLDYGIEFIYLLPEGWLGQFTPGIDLKFSNLGIVSPTASNQRGAVRKFSFGVILPLKDSEGKSTINIIPFYERKKFIDFAGAEEDFTGIKFSLPFGSFVK